MRTTLRQPYRQFLGTLANQVRLDIIDTLQKGPRRVGEIVAALPYEQSTISHSLKRLETCGFVTVQQNGKGRVYTLNTTTIKPLFALMNTHMNRYCKHIIGGEACH